MSETARPKVYALWSDKVHRYGRSSLDPQSLHDDAAPGWRVAVLPAFGSMVPTEFWEPPRKFAVWNDARAWGRTGPPILSTDPAELRIYCTEPGDRIALVPPPEPFDNDPGSSLIGKPTLFVRWLHDWNGREAAWVLEDDAETQEQRRERTRRLGEERRLAAKMAEIEANVARIAELEKAQARLYEERERQTDAIKQANHESNRLRDEIRDLVWNDKTPPPTPG